MSLVNRDKNAVWHPLTQHKTASDPIALVRAKGAMLYDEAGRSYVDGIASWYTAMYGHCNEYIIDAVTTQMKELDQVVFTGFTHEPAVKLSEMLLEILPSNQERIFFNDNGSTAVDAAIKMAVQYHHNRGDKKDTLIAFEHAFHGDTFGAMSASGLSVYNGPFESLLLNVERVSPPHKDNQAEVIERFRMLAESGNCAAFIYEPLVQGAAGMKFHDGTVLDQLIEIAQSNDILCIADEVMTGFGKTGKNFASEYLSSEPDIICLSKALTAGMVPMGITSCSKDIFDAFLSEEVAKGFFHAHTYSANPPACAAAIAGIELLKSEKIQKGMLDINRMHNEFSGKLKGYDQVINRRVLGVILAIELDVDISRYGDFRNKMFNYLMDKGVFLRPLGNTIYVLPPYTIEKAELELVYDAIVSMIEDFIPSLIN